jgi:hypothetical protein
VASLGTKDKILNRDHRAARLLRSNGERIPDMLVDKTMRVRGS